MTVAATASMSSERAFDVIAPIDLTRIFTGYGPLPAVVGVRDQSGAWDHVGASRVVRLADGNEAREEITAYERPGHFGYRLEPLTGPLRLLVRAAEGAWWFSPEGDHTTIRWTYVFHPRRVTRLPVRLVLAPLWRAYARRVLARAVRIVESGG